MKIQNRIIIVGIIMTLLSFTLLIRLAALQWFPKQQAITVKGKLSYNRNWRYDALRQRQHSVVLNNGRALFKDDQGQYLHSTISNKLLLTPYLVQNKNLAVLKQSLTSILDLSPQLIAQQIEHIKHPKWLVNEQGQPILLTDNQLDELQKANWFGLYTFSTIDEDEYAAYSHVVGFTAENPEVMNGLHHDKLNKLNNWSISSSVGVIGLERSLDRWLHGVEQEKVVWYEDVEGNMIEGLGLNYTGKHQYYPLVVETTLNSTIQNQINLLVENHKATQIAVVLLDVATNDIKAMVSKPTLFPRKLNEDSMKNLAITSYRPGSIYKLATLVAALEYNHVEEDETFYCDGEYGKYGLSCWKHDGHGKQTLEEAFANSCNVAFAQLSERLTAAQLYNTVLTLGGIETIGWNSEYKGQQFGMLLEEERGRAFISNETADRGEIAQAAIGQRDTLLTPLQAASIVATIARGGQPLQARAAKGIYFQDGQPLVQFDKQKQVVSRYALKPSTIKTVERYMEAVVKQGTGQLLSGANVSVAGKSGTAQLADSTDARNNYWFIGYFPVENPTYAMAVVVLNEKTATNSATSLFKTIVDSLYTDTHK